MQRLGTLQHVHANQMILAKHPENQELARNMADIANILDNGKTIIFCINIHEYRF
jgi:hypothetical protein